jgi:hypothetical protein
MRLPDRSKAVVTAITLCTHMQLQFRYAISGSRLSLSTHSGVMPQMMELHDGDAL